MEWIGGERKGREGAGEERLPITMMVTTWKGQERTGWEWNGSERNGWERLPK